jgi:hypothetical protein
MVVCVRARWGRLCPLPSLSGGPITHARTHAQPYSRSTTATPTCSESTFTLPCKHILTHTHSLTPTLDPGPSATTTHSCTHSHSHTLTQQLQQQPLRHSQHRRKSVRLNTPIFTRLVRDDMDPRAQGAGTQTYVNPPSPEWTSVNCRCAAFVMVIVWKQWRLCEHSRLAYSGACVNTLVWRTVALV